DSCGADLCFYVVCLQGSPADRRGRTVLFYGSSESVLCRLRRAEANRQRIIRESGWISSARDAQQSLGDAREVPKGSRDRLALCIGQILPKSPRARGRGGWRTSAPADASAEKGCGEERRRKKR